MKKEKSLKAKKDFELVLRKGRKKYTPYISFFYLKAEEFKIGISIPKKLGNAVLRNKQKRQLKQIISKSDIQNYKYNFVVIVREKWIDKKFSFHEKQIHFENTFKKLDL